MSSLNVYAVANAHGQSCAPFLDRTSHPDVTDLQPANFLSVIDREMKDVAKVVLSQLILMEILKV